MNLPKDQHDGRCGHCRTAVPLDAVVCTGCGARWGSSTGKSRQQVYEESKGKVIASVVSCLLLALILPLAVWLFPESLFIAALVGIAWGGASLQMLLSGAIDMRRAKTNIYITWWHKN